MRAATRGPGDRCAPEQFECLSNRSCIPASYQCDEEPDCPDRSDEYDCSKSAISRMPHFPAFGLQVCVFLSRERCLPLSFQGFTSFPWIAEFPS